MTYEIDPPPEQPKTKLVLAHQMRLEDILLSKTDIPTFTGHLIRKTETDSAKRAMWEKTCREFKGEYAMSKTVTPPKAETLAFTWSPSKLACFELCPVKYAAEYCYKTVPYQETIHTIWGNRVHSEAERFMKKEVSTDAEALAVVLPYLTLLDNLPGQRYIEYRIGVTENWKPLAVPVTNKPWDWGETVGRMAVDLAIVNGKVLQGFDWKTGKMKDDDTQLKINALCLALLHPEIDEFDMKYIWLKAKKTTGFKLQRKDLVAVYKNIKGRVGRLKEAFDSEVFIARKNYLCKSWCDVTDCAHCGKGG
jgi:hypothetical protein